MTGTIGSVFKSPNAGVDTSFTVSSFDRAGHLHPVSSGYVPLGMAKEIAPTLRDFRIDPDPVIREAGLDPSLFDNESYVIPQAGLGRLLTLSVARTRCSCFGLLVGQRATILSLGLVGRLMQRSETLGQALDSLVAYLSVQNGAVGASVTIDGGMALLTYAAHQPETASAAQVTDMALAASVNVLRTLCGSEWAPTEVLVPRTAPADTKAYQAHFRAPVRFDEETATLVVPEKDLKRRVAGADPVLRAVLDERLRQMRADASSAFSDDIRRLLRIRMTVDRWSVEDVAEHLSMHRRTLSRRLKERGLGYRILSNEIRFEFARRMLEDTQVPLGQIAAALGYSEASAFTRAFRRWSGQAPSIWRARGSCK